MRKALYVLLVGVLLLSTFAVVGSKSTASADESKVLQFNTMIGVPRPFTRGNGNAIRNIDGGGLPWVIAFGNGVLRPDGEINILIKGLVLDPNDPGTIAAGVAGTNPIPNFKAIVSCLSKDENGNAVTVNVSTGLFPADEEGNAHIMDTVALPQPCIAPIIFVASPGGNWFATTGF